MKIGRNKTETSSVPEVKKRDTPGFYDFACAILWGPNQRRFWIPLAVLGIFYLILRIIWGLVGPEVTAGGAYRVELRRIFIENPVESVPPSLVSDVLAELAADQKTPLKITDPTLPERLDLAFGKHPLVRSVESIRIEYPARIRVRLEFREPVALVEVPDGIYGKQAPEKIAVFPIDADGVLIPTDYLEALLHRSPDAAYEFLMIRGIQSTPLGGDGEPWNDPLVHQSAILAELLQPDAKHLGLRRIHVRDNPQNIDAPEFDLETTRGTKIHWGRFDVQGLLGAGRLGDLARFDNLKKNLFQQERSRIDSLLGLIDRYGSLDDLPADMVPLDISGR